MPHERTAVRLLTDLLTPGAILLGAAWAIQRELVVHAAVAPYVSHVAFGALLTAILLCWYHDQSRLLSVAVSIALAVIALEFRPASVMALGAVFLLPLNFVLFAAFRESGVLASDGLLKLAVLAAQAVALVWINGEPAAATASSAFWKDGIEVVPEVPRAAWTAYAIAGIALGTLILRRRTKVEQGMLWALVAMFLGVNELSTPDALLYYAGAAGLVLVLAGLEHGYDIAYRDELTGLPGRRAFNSMMGQLGRTYAIAMCDVDHFKKFNDMYGHDAGDQVLRMVATKLSDVGGGGRVFRYGGEEFLVVFRGRSAAEAEPYADDVRKAIAEAGFVLRAPDRPPRKPPHIDANRQKDQRTAIDITVSIGIAERSHRHSTPELVLDAADEALYRAKGAGRNCVKVAGTDR